MTKEEIYDRDIAPLEKTIVSLCRENKIGFLMFFETSSDEASPSYSVKPEVAPSPKLAALAGLAEGTVAAVRQPPRPPSSGQELGQAAAQETDPMHLQQGNAAAPRRRVFDDSGAAWDGSNN